jgi:4-amino-4-deoxy-L-arabinose transferase-like glycosyltransferase
MVGVIAGRLAGPRAATVSAFIAACYPPLVWISAYALSEALFWPVGLLVVYLVDRGTHAEDGRRWALGAGLTAGVGILIRPALILFLPLVALWWIWRRRPFLVLALAVGTWIVVLPWTVRNLQHHGQLVIVASDGGVTFWTGNHPLATGEGDMAANPAIKLDNQRLRSQHPGLTEEQMEPIYYAEALAWIRSHPFDWIALEAKKLFFTIVPLGPSYRLHSWLYFLASVLSYLALAPIALVGFDRLRGRRMHAMGRWCLALSAMATCLIFFPQERFRIPVIDPVLAICAGAAIGGRRT